MLVVRGSNDEESHVYHVEEKHKDLNSCCSLNFFDWTCQPEATASFWYRKNLHHLPEVRRLEDVLLLQQQHKSVAFFVSCVNIRA